MNKKYTVKEFCEKSITEVVIPSDISVIKNDTFSGYSNLNVILEGDTEIEPFAFSGTPVVLSTPEGVFDGTQTKPRFKRISDSEIHYCLNNGIEIPISIDEMKSNYETSGGVGLAHHYIKDYGTLEAFLDCESLEEIIVGNSVTSVEERAFSRCESLFSITYQGTIAQWKKIELGNGWNDDIPAKVVHCTDGDVKI